MDEMEKYRSKIERRYRRRRTGARFIEGGRRNDDYKSPPIFYWSDLFLILPLVVSGLCVLFLSGCVAIKKSLFGG